MRHFARLFPSFICLLGFVLSNLSDAHAQQGGSAVRATVTFSGSKPPTLVDLISFSNGTLSFRDVSDNYTASLPVEQIDSVQIERTPQIKEGLEAVQRHQWPLALDKLHSIARSLPQFMSLPGNDFRGVADAFALAAINAGRFSILREVFEQLKDSPDPEFALEGQAWIAYLDVREKKNVELDLLRQLSEKSEQSSTRWLLAEVALANEALNRSDIRAATDHSARVIALANIDLWLFQEALSIARQAYIAQAEAQLDLLRAERDALLTEAVRVERIRVGRELQLQAQEEQGSNPTEEQIVSAIDRDALDAKIPPLPPIEDLEPYKSANEVARLQNRLFPNSPSNPPATP